MIIEGVLTTRNQDGSTHATAMGPVVDPALTAFTLRPFQSSHSFTNLMRTKCGVFHVTDDVELIALSAIGKLSELPALRPANRVDGHVLQDACRVYELQVASVDRSRNRSEIACQVETCYRQRDFFGFCRAKHAVIEAAILATRLAFLPLEEVQQSYAQLAVIVEKTAGPAERRAFAALQSFIGEYVAESHGTPSACEAAR